MKRAADQLARGTPARARRSCAAAIAGILAALAGCLGSTALAAAWTAKLPSGKVLNIEEGATETGMGYFLERRYAGAARDVQFGSGGRTFFTLGADNSPPATLQVDPAGRILVGGSATASGGRSAVVVLRFLANGQVDPAWGQQGRSVVQVARGEASAADAVALPDGQVLVLGTVDDEPAERAALWRLTEDGRLDPSFGTAGMLIATGLPQSSGVSIQRTDDGMLHIALQVGRGETTWLEVHRWAPGTAAPQRVARQQFPDDWVGPAELTQRGGTWAWVDSSQPLAAPLALVTAGPGAFWPASANTVLAAPSTDAPQATGHAAVNPFSDAASAAPTGSVMTLDDLAWPAMVLGVIALLAAGIWWAMRDG